MIIKGQQLKRGGLRQAEGSRNLSVEVGSFAQRVTSFDTRRTNTHNQLDYSQPPLSCAKPRSVCVC